MSTPSDPAGDSAVPARRRWRRLFSVKRVLLVLLGLFLVGVAAFGVAYAKVDVPQPNDLANAQASIIYYADGKTEMGRISVVNRESVPLSKIPLHVQHALLAAEDRTFYENHGISFSGIGRALVVALKGGRTQGASTITQQYVKNYFLTQDRTVTRKAKEFIISIKIDQQESKDTILANYLNTIYYGRGASGIQTASRAYFGHDASRLTVAEGALLASVIRGPLFYDPGLGASQKANATARVSYVLDGMVTKGWLSPQARAAATFPRTIPEVKPTKVGSLTFVIDKVKSDLTQKIGLNQSDIDRGGLRIVTTIDKKAQNAAVKAVDDNLPSDKQAAGCGRKKSGACRLHVGLTAIKPGDGAIVAMYGGKDISRYSTNTSTQAIPQAGSTFKVFGLLAALQKDISTKTKYSGYSPRYLPEFVSKKVPDGKVKNFGDEQFGRIDLRKALAHSVNTVFAQLNVDLAAPGTQAKGVRDAAVAAGLPKGCPGSKLGPGCTPGLTTNINNILGTASPHVIDMANAFATIAAKGKRATPYLITSVTSANKSIDYTVDRKTVRAFDQKVTTDVTDAMTRVVTEGTAAKNAQGLGRPAAGKTGTTTDSSAAWFDGFTPQLSAAVGIYQGEGGTTSGIKVQGINEFTGSGVPVQIWTAFMKGALDGEPVIDFPQRVGVGDNLLPPPPPPPTTPPTSAPTFVPNTPSPAPATTQVPTATSTPSPTVTQPTGPTGPPPTHSRPPSTPAPPTVPATRAGAKPPGGGNGRKH